MEIEELARDDENMMNSALISEELNVNTSLNHSGLLRFTLSNNESTTQTEWNDNFCEKSRNFKDSTKVALIVSSATALLRTSHE